MNIGLYISTLFFPTLTHAKTLLDNEFTYKLELELLKLTTGKHLVWTTMKANIGQRVKEVRTRGGG